LIIPFKALANNPNLPVATSILSYSSTNVTTSAWVQVTASLPANISHIEVFDSSGQTMQLGTGLSGQEVALPFTNFPGGISSNVNLYYQSRIVIEAISGTASSGTLIINYYL
jgi:hypothetical protein